jgi:hypothetical protein
VEEFTLDNTLNEDKIVKIKIDLEELKKNEINESFLAMFAGTIKSIMKYIFAPPGQHIPKNFFEFKGRRGDLNSFARTLGNEKKYLEAFKKHGLDHPDTYKSKSVLDKSIKNFEKSTGLKWPYK